MTPGGQGFLCLPTSFFHINHVGQLPHSASGCRGQPETGRHRRTWNWIFLGFLGFLMFFEGLI